MTNDPKDADPSKLDLSRLPQTAKEMKTALRKGEREDKKFNDDLLKRAKSVDILMVGLECVIVGTEYHQQGTSFTPRSEMVLEGNSPNYCGGHLYGVELKVESDASVQKLLFKGWPYLEAGDMLKAYIFKGKKEYERGCGLIVPKNVEELPDFHKDIFKNVPFHWVERDYQAVEHPFKIEKLRDGKVVATYHNS